MRAVKSFLTSAVRGAEYTIKSIFNYINMYITLYILKMHTSQRPSVVNDTPNEENL